MERAGWFWGVDALSRGCIWKRWGQEWGEPGGRRKWGRRGDFRDGLGQSREGGVPGQGAWGLFQGR